MRISIEEAYQLLRNDSVVAIPT
ncbi:MAG: hypothetical protein JWO53_1284, partial [Chlamydiia bacterium]|nr:hypothetical protein [Chlamydiia bacterium]